MTEANVARGREPVPFAMSVLLSFVAGYVDSYTYLALFGLFVAQVTSSIVIAGAEVVRHDFGAIGKVLVLVIFLVAAATTAALVGAVRDAGRAPLPWMLALEAALLVIFVGIALFAPAIAGPGDWHGVVAGLFAAAAMGTQSVLVRLLMKGIPQTNVMTGNMTQLGIAATELILAWRRYRFSAHAAAEVGEFRKVRDQLVIVLAIASGFLVGAAAGAAAFAVIGVPGALAAVAIVGALALWAVLREPRG